PQPRQVLPRPAANAPSIHDALPISGDRREVLVRWRSDGRPAGVEPMVVVALITWFLTVSAGLYLLAIWLIEYDIGAPGGAVSRLPRTDISGHGLLASTGLLVWIGYL